MWANTVWGFLGSALTCFVAMLSFSDHKVREDFWYAMLGFLVLSLLTLLFPSVWRWLQSLFSKPALEIVFDPANSARRFWSMESTPHPTESKNIPDYETRVQIRNSSTKTLRNVRVSASSIGELPSRPTLAPFDTSKGMVAEIHPGCAELVPVIRWPHPRVQAGMPALESALMYGPLEIVASADDTPAAVRRFSFDYQKDPMIYE